MMSDWIERIERDERENSLVGSSSVLGSCTGLSHSVGHVDRVTGSLEHTAAVKKTSFSKGAESKK